MKKLFLTLAVTAAITGCATSPDKLPTSQVSALQYQEYDCDQIKAELANVNKRTATLYSSLKETADNDVAQTAVGMLLFWPALFFLEGGDGPEAAEYSRLKGENEALEKAAIQKKCGIGSTLEAAAKPEKEGV